MAVGCGGRQPELSIQLSISSIWRRLSCLPAPLVWCSESSARLALLEVLWTQERCDMSELELRGYAVLLEQVKIGSPISA